MKAMDTALLEEIVRRVISEELKNLEDQELDKTVDPSGIIHVRSGSVNCKPFDTGKAGDKVFITDLYTLGESPNMACGIMEMEESAFDWTLTYDEIDFIIEGTLEIIINNRKVVGNKGDVLFIPKDTRIQFSCPKYTRFLFVTYPANWEELSKG
ncbi:cupin domain-containing protein [Alkaliphilus serpentinus]|uniref:DUF861 domain-containing protein n=1 Tax=Alkaliphilus serpentinus TaxID=1482731 RepID=A0A833MCK4_9FIRM|nr:cupin domain-containing protein [Alkaliphilus serpentinus]KAB3525613.1 DUF861 domain-containing protein [Alkaliphilus serpentinus]